MADIDRIKMILNEYRDPYFSDAELTQWAREIPDEDERLYTLLMNKAQRTSMKVSGLSLADSSSYYKELAQRYEPVYSGTL
jgi:two-component SAPR family response regulator